MVVHDGGERWTPIGEVCTLARMPSELAVRDLALLRAAVLSTYIDIGGVEYGWPKYNLVAATVWLQSSTTPRREESLVLPM